MLRRCSTRSDANIWAEVCKCASDRSMLVTGMELECARHPKYKKTIQVGDTASDTELEFRAHFPDGGCHEPCIARLTCGHQCPLKCHDESLHLTVNCRSECARLCSAGHNSCKKKCFQQCSPCATIVTKIVPTCGHVNTMACWIDEKTFICEKESLWYFNCGHYRVDICGNNTPAAEIQISDLCDLCTSFPTL